MQVCSQCPSVLLSMDLPVLASAQTHTGPLNLFKQRYTNYIIIIVCPMHDNSIGQIIKSMFDHLSVSVLNNVI